MILNARNKKPKISFGLGATELSVNEGTNVTVWLENIFSENEFQFSIIGVEVTKITSYEWQIGGLEKGDYKIEMEISAKEIKPEPDPEPGPKPKSKPLPKPKSLISNPITLTVL